MEKCGIEELPVRAPLHGSILKFFYLNGFSNVKGKKGCPLKEVSGDGSSNHRLIKTFIHSD